jgi:hypothetical protein
LASISDSGEEERRNDHLPYVLAEYSTYFFFPLERNMEKMTAHEIDDEKL